MNKILSIIVPSYNMEAYLSKCLGSLVVDDEDLLQKLDVIIVNDGSKDRTSEIAHEYAEKYPGVFRVIDKLNGNYGSCINTALSVLEGEYVKILDADDSFTNDNFSCFLDFLTHTHADMVLTDTIYLDDSTGDTTAVINYKLPKEVAVSVEDVLVKYIYINMNTITYRSSIFQGGWYKQTEGISYTDTQWSILPLSKIRTVFYFPKTVYRYTVARSGQTMEAVTIAKNFWMMAKCALDTVRQYIVICEDIKGKHRELMDSRIIRFASLPYNRPFKKVNGVKYNIDLETYDRDLKDISQWIYDAVGEIQSGGYIKCKCAANWRRHSINGYLRLRLFAMANVWISQLGTFRRKIKRMFK